MNKEQAFDIIKLISDAVLSELKVPEDIRKMDDPRYYIKWESSRWSKDTVDKVILYNHITYTEIYVSVENHRYISVHFKRNRVEESYIFNAPFLRILPNKAYKQYMKFASVIGKFNKIERDKAEQLALKIKSIDFNHAFNKAFPDEINDILLGQDD